MRLSNTRIKALVTGWDRGKNRARNIKLNNGRKVNIQGYLMLNNLHINNYRRKYETTR